jgi:hypothetical protein
VAYNVQIGTNKIKLLTEYGNVTQNVLSLVESILKNAKQLQQARLSWHVRFENYRPGGGVGGGETTTII